MKHDLAKQFPFLHGIEVHEFLYQKDDVVSPHSSLWGDFNFSLNGTLEFDIEGKYYLSPPAMDCGYHRVLNINRCP